MSDTPRPPRNVTSVGGLVVRDDQLLLVRMTYGPSKDRYMLPGGLVDPGETIDVAVVREVLEETSVIAEPVGIVGIRTRYDGLNTDNYILWLLRHVDGEPRPCERENDDARYFSLTELEEREDITYLASYLGKRVLSQELRPMVRQLDYEYQIPGSTPDSWKLFM